MELGNIFVLLNSSCTQNLLFCGQFLDNLLIIW